MKASEAPNESGDTPDRDGWNFSELEQLECEDRMEHMLLDALLIEREITQRRGHD